MVDIHKAEFEELGLIENGKVPSHDTFLNIFYHLDALSLRDAFIEKFRQFLESAYNLVEDKTGKYRLLSGDGKTFNGPVRKNGKKNLNVFNMYSASSSICSISVPLTSKDSEIPEFQKLLVKYNLRRTIVTADALHCQRKACEAIISKKGHYLIKAKDNQEALVEEIEMSFSNPKYSKKTKKTSPQRLRLRDASHLRHKLAGMQGIRQDDFLQESRSDELQSGSAVFHHISKI